MRTIRSLLLCAPLVSLLLTPVRAEDGVFTEETLPPGWSITRLVEVPDTQLEAFGSRLGGTLQALRNQFLDVNGFPAQLNDVEAADAASAEAVHGALRRMRGDDFVARRGHHVLEVAGNNVLAARRVRAARGIPSATVATYDVTLSLALVDEVVEAERNDVFNAFLALEREPGDEAHEAAIRDATRDWTFGDTLRLLAPEAGCHEATWSFEPEPVEVREEGGWRTYRFEDAPRVAGVPTVLARGRVTVHSRYEPTPGEAPAVLAAPTARWPAEPVLSLARDAVRDVTELWLRVLVLLRACGERVRHGGRTGSRDPVETVIRRGHGHCFDRSDVFVAACRSVGIPARERAGWVPPLEAGHVWCEVFLEGEGWIPVDATTTWLGTSFDYLPFFGTEEGAMPFLYTAWPRIERR